MFELMFYGHVMCVHLQQPERSVIFIFFGLFLSRLSNNEKLTRLKIAADISMAFAGEFFTKEIGDRDTVVQIEVSFESIGSKAIN